jgi:cellulose synthase/poly-beta-1,6-N-acetylglucosamine synthase-like glycosyltransferase
LSRPRVSVLLPFRDEEDYLEAALSSLSAQDMPDFEVVMVDDGSADGSPGIAGEWEERDRRFRLLRCGRRGLVEALNAGLARCRGEWVARMDADDVSHPRRLGLQLEAALDSGPRTVVSCLAELFPGERVSTGMRMYMQWLNGLTSPAEIRAAIFVESPLPHPSVLFHRETVLGAGGYRDLGVPEDYELWLRLWKLGSGFRKVKRTLLRWRERPDRLSRSSSTYARQRFYRLKAMYLPLAPALAGGRAVLWGSGQSGRRLSRWLLREGLEIEAFVDVAPSRTGHRLRGRPIVPPDRLRSLEGLPVLVCTRSLRARREIETWLQRSGRREWEDYICCG